MNDEEAERPQPKLRWFQVSLRTLLALVLGFGLGLALNYRFRPEESTLPNPANVRRGDRVRVEWRRIGVEGWIVHTATVLADGSIRLRELGGVPAAGMSMDALSDDLKARYSDYCAKRYGVPPEIEIFVDFGSPLPKE